MADYRIPFPDDDYLAAIGRMTYAIGYLEWSILGDLPQIDGLPEALTVEKLAGKTVADIGKTLQSNLDGVEDSETRAWLKMAADYLLSFSNRRNAVLHGRPATTDDGEPQLSRWTKKPGEQYFITPKLLEDLVSDIDLAVTDLSSKRVLKLG
ncbi:hypothetical protein [Rhodococcus sp. IEGM 1374]|uniref:hypothetical protein n=1 Tax=Rhodococcus sp. IEGM 1374 TaxID=3082221 RepID=UPI0029550712|nr:hypothetical protein [Rhodococcus sp. IEGM 1374]MDV7992079.1 hypothetical protein [Rhodococcus sp. IEGM 1374]